MKIDARHFSGKLNYGEIFLRGKDKREIFLSTYICHPSMANNELSGPVVTSFIANFLNNLKSEKRKICTNLLAITLDILLKWFAPILSFTTEEIFQIINKEKNLSIHLENFPKIPTHWENKKLCEKWEKLKIIRNVVNAGIEVKRSNKDIGSSLEADIEIYLGKEYLELVKDINLSEYFITSMARVKKMTDNAKIFKLKDIPNIGVLVEKAKGEKCSRCWKILGNPCERCGNVLKN